MRKSRIEAIYNGVEARLEKSYTLCYVDYRDNMDGCHKLFDKCVDNECSDNLWLEIDEAYSEERYQSAVNILDEIRKDMKIQDWTWEEFKMEDEYNELRWLIEERDDSKVTEDLLNQTDIDARIAIMSNYECCAAHWSQGLDMMGDPYLVQLMAWLSLNPAKLKKEIMERCECTSREIPGRWPNIKSREGKEVVTYEAFVDSWFNSPNMGEFNLFGRLPLYDLLKNDFKFESDPSHWTIPTGTTCGFFNSWCGGGTLSIISTIRSVNVGDILKKNKPKNATQFDYLKLMVDEKGCHGYSSGEVYGGSMSTDQIMCA